MRDTFIPASIPESYEYYGAMAGLLTYSPYIRPSHAPKRAQWLWNGQRLKELTAAGQFRNYTGFPFNHITCNEAM